MKAATATGVAVLLAATLLNGCASMPPPTGELAAAQQSVARADASDADQYAGAEIARARNALAQAQAALAEGDDDDARAAAAYAAAMADLATARSRAASGEAELAQRQAEIVELEQRLGVEAGVTPPRVWTPAAAFGGAADQPALERRLQAIDAEPQLQGLAAYERLRARQALDALAQAGKRERPQALSLAQARVEAAEAAARTELFRREVDRFDRARSELLVEASRQDAARARAEAERLRIEAQIQAEEAQRLRAAAEAEAAARQQAEGVIQEVAGDQAAKLAAAREKEAALAREEAELMAGGKLPPSRRDAGGEVFTLSGDAFPSGKATLTPAAAASVKALAAYLQAGPAVAVRIEGHTDSQGEAPANQQLSQRRAEAVRDALAAAGVPRRQLQAVGRGEDAPIADNANAAGRSRNRRVEIIVTEK